MGKIIDVVALGELLIDFTPAGISTNGMRLFEQNPGGAPANMLAALAKTGLKTSFIGKVGADMHGLFLKEVLEKNSIDTRGLVVDESVFTTLAFVSLSKEGERTFSFSRKPGADTNIKIEEVDKTLLDTCRIFHIGSLSLTDEPARHTTFEAVKRAKAAGAYISYDPNYRTPLWKDVEVAKDMMRCMIPYVDIMKISDEETHLLTPCKEPKEAAMYLLSKGVKIVVVTLGARGAYIATKYMDMEVAGFKSQVVDTTGAGDSFWGGLLSWFIKQDIDIDAPKKEELYDMVRFGNAMASLCVERRGGISGIPSIEEIERRLKG